MSFCLYIMKTFMTCSWTLLYIQLTGDVFSGVGPLAISAAKIVKRVFANDLNPYAVEYLERNSVLNKLERKIKVWLLVEWVSSWRCFMNCYIWNDKKEKSMMGMGSNFRFVDVISWLILKVLLINFVQHFLDFCRYYKLKLKLLQIILSME